MQRYAPDTNFFLQFKPAEDLPWSEVTDTAEIELIVLADVLGELDKHKNGGNERRAQRSRSVLQRFRPLILGEVEELPIREKNPRITYRLAPSLPANRAKPETLDTGTPDGRIVWEALTCSAMMDGLALLTHDGLPMLTARRHGLPIVALPDSWRLAPERNAKDKEIARLREELGAMKRREPDILVSVLRAGESLERIEGDLVRYAPLSSQFLTRAMQAVEVRHPAETVRVPGRIVVTREADRETYERERAEWVDKIRGRLERHPNALNLENSLFPLSLMLQNLGSASAESLVVEVFAEGSICLVSPAGLANFLGKHKFGLPQPPRMRHFMDLSDSLGPYDTPLPDVSRLRGADVRPNTLPRDFHWKFDGPLVSSHRLEGVCIDFRHRIHTEEVALALAVPEPGVDEPVGCIRIRYSATNLNQPVEKVWPVRFTYAWQGTEPETARLLKDQLDVKLG